VDKVKAQEQANQVVAVMDVDASLQVAKEYFYRMGRMFALQAAGDSAGAGWGRDQNDKKQLLKQLASPVPIIPSKRNIEIPGAQAKVRITNGRPSSTCGKLRPIRSRRRSSCIAAGLENRVGDRIGACDGKGEQTAAGIDQEPVWTRRG